MAFAGAPHIQSGRLVLEIFAWLVNADVVEAPLVAEVRSLWG